MNHRDKITKLAARLIRRSRGAFKKREAREAAGDWDCAMTRTDFIAIRQPGGFARDWEITSGAVSEITRERDRAERRRFAIAIFDTYGASRVRAEVFRTYQRAA